MRPLVGIGFIGLGGIMLYGGITGRLAPMLAALFVPSALTERSSQRTGFGQWVENLPDWLVPDDIPGVAGVMTWWGGS